MIRRGIVAGGAGLVATVLAVAVVLLPETVLSVGPVGRAAAFLARRDPRSVLLAAGSLAGLVALVVAGAASRRRTVGEDEPARRIDRPRESVGTDGRAAPGSTLDDRLDRVAGGAHGPRAEVRETLRATAVRRLARVEGDPGAARRAVETGDWTDDRLAAGYLGETTTPLSARLRAWLDPEAEHHRRVERTLAAIEALGERR